MGGVSRVKENNTIKYVEEEFYKSYKHYPEIIVSAPGRIDFLNTHQDYKGLPVVSIGIDLRTYVAISRSNSDKCIVESINLRNEGREYRDVFNASRPMLRNGKWFGNYLRASILSLERMGYSVEGFNALIYSDVPVAAGLASSAALEVSFIGALNQLFGFGLSRMEIAEAAYTAEHDIMGIPCGRLDQYGSSYGGIIKINTRPPYGVEELPWINGVFTVVDSGIKHSTADIHPRRQAEINKGLELLLEMPDLPNNVKKYISPHHYDTYWEEIDFEKIKNYLDRLPSPYRERVLFTFKMHNSTMLALKIIRDENVEFEEIVSSLDLFDVDTIKNALKDKPRLIGLVMDYQHILLRDYYDLSLPALERIRNNMKEAGALGAKLSGAGLGGAIIGLTMDIDTAKKVLEAGISGGGKRGWIVNIDDGVRVEELDNR